jgi:hypothetical protein
MIHIGGYWGRKYDFTRCQSKLEDIEVNYQLLKHVGL